MVSVWFSPNFMNRKEKNGNGNLPLIYVYYKLEDGRIVLSTSVSNNSENSGTNWIDSIYLGEGEFLRAYAFPQREFDNWPRPWSIDL